MYRPNDIKRPREIRVGLVCGPNNHVYTGVFGTAEYEMIAQRIVFDSQGWGRWVSLSEGLASAVLVDGVGLNPTEALQYAQHHLGRMVEKGLLERDNEGYRLTESAIKRLVERFPASGR